MSTEEKQREIKESLVARRMESLSDIGAAMGKPLEGKAREKAQRESEEICRRIVERGGNQVSYYRPRR